MTTSFLPASAAPDAAALRATRGDLVRRLLLPRGLETLNKWLLLPVGGLVAVSQMGALPPARLLAQAALLWLVVEQLAYQARYQLNDLRDRRADNAHPEKRSRGRLAMPWTRCRAALVWGSVAVRVVLAVLLVATVLDGRPQQAGAVFLLLMVPISAAYEAARERMRRSPVDLDGPGVRGHALPVLLVVPLGYGLRVWTGYHALAAPDAGPALAVLLVLAVIAVYTGSVLLAWALEGSSFVLPDATLRPGLGAKAHLALLVRHTGLLDVVPATLSRPAATSLVLARDRPARGPLDMKAWDLAAAVALPLGYAVAAAGVDADRLTTAVLALAAATGVVLPLALRIWAPGPPVWDTRPSWLGAGGLARTVAVEVAALGLAAAVVLVHDAPQGRLLWLPAFFLFVTGAVRTSSRVRGFGPLSMIKRPVLWLREQHR